MSQAVDWLITLSLLIGLFARLDSKAVFLEHSNAVQLLRVRRPRANYFLEEIMPGNLERECYEETCSQEEASEIFQTKEKTLEFWYRYKNMKSCRHNPCVNGGICTMDWDQHLCLCPPRFEGKHCETEVFECQYRNGGCRHFCTNKERTERVECSCADGYQLQEDGKSCEPRVMFPCGKKWPPSFVNSRSLLETHLLNDTAPLTPPPPNSSHTRGNLTLSWTNSSQQEDGATDSGLPQQPEGEESSRIVGGQLEKQGGSPWQVLIRRKDGYGFCGGTLINQQWVISAAHCFQERADHVTIGDYDKMLEDKGEQMIKVEEVVVHPHFHEFTYDSDVALLRLARPAVLSPVATPACLPNQHLARHLQRDVSGVVTGWGATQYMGKSSRFLRKVSLPVMEQQKCILSTEQVITDNMFCAGYLDASLDSCSGDSGGPFVVNHHGTWFLTGVVSWGEKCAAVGKYGVYTRLGNFLQWIRDTLEKQEQNQTTVSV